MDPINSASLLSLNNFPEKIQEIICRKLDYSTQVKVALICKRWLQIVKRHTLDYGKPFAVRQMAYSQPCVNTFLTFHQQARLNLAVLAADRKFLFIREREDKKHIYIINKEVESVQRLSDLKKIVRENGQVFSTFSKRVIATDHGYDRNDHFTVKLLQSEDGTHYQQYAVLSIPKDVKVNRATASALGRNDKWIAIACFYHNLLESVSDSMELLHNLLMPNLPMPLKQYPTYSRDQEIYFHIFDK